MSDKEGLFLKKLQNTLLTAFASLLVLIVVTVVPFYFNTVNATEHLQEQVKELKESKADKEVYQITIQRIDKKLDDLTKKLE